MIFLSLLKRNPMMQAELIEKEKILSLKFPQHDVLHGEDERVKRQAELVRAMLIGNNDKGKIKLIFDTLEGTKMVETTVWATTNDSVTLKKGIMIPLNCIREVVIY
jgi:hypothetical protein